MSFARRDFLKAVAIGAAGVFLPLPLAAKDSMQSPKRPNVIIFLADDLGYGDLGCYGHPFIKTPNLDKFASEGLRLTECYSASPICSPARAGLLTGRFPYKVGVYHLAGKSVHLRRQEKTIAELLGDVGYKCGFFGKWHLGNLNGKHPLPTEHGFDHYFATKGNCYPLNPDKFNRNGKAVGRLEGAYCDIIVEESFRWIDSLKNEEPFFIELCSSEPHTPIAPPPGYAEMYGAAEIKKSDDIKYGGVIRYPHIKEVDHKKKEYYGTITALDAAFGRLMGKLAQRKLTDNTIVIFTSDNGPEFPGGSTRWDKWRDYSWGSPGELRGMKRHLYEGGIRVPGIIRWPERIKPGSVSSEPVSSVDFLPTLNELCGVATKDDLQVDGVSIAGIFEEKSVKRTSPLCWNINFAGVPNMTMRSGDYMLVGFAGKRKAGQGFMQWLKDSELVRFELYDVKKDPAQTTDLASTNENHLKALIIQMKDLWKVIQQEGPNWPAGGVQGIGKPAVGTWWQ